MELTSPGIFELGLVLLLAALAGWLARALQLPAVVGYLAVGLALSPFTPGYVADRGQLAFLADLGVVLLLFEVGIEIDLSQLRRDHGAISWLAPLQVAITTAVTAIVLTLAGVAPAGAALVGIGLAMSSSVVIVNITRSRRRTTSPDGAGWLGLLLALVVAKSIIVAAFARSAGLRADWRQLAVGLGQAGEFSFVLASAALTLGAIAGDLYAAVLGCVVVSIIASTMLVRRVGTPAGHGVSPAS